MSPSGWLALPSTVQWPHDTVARQLFEQRTRDAGAVVDPGAFGVEVDVGPVLVAAIGAVDRAQGPVGDVDEGVGPRHVLAAGVEQPVVRFFQCLVDDGAFVGGELEVQGETAVLVVAVRQPARRQSRRDPCLFCGVAFRGFAFGFRGEPRRVVWLLVGGVGVLRLVVRVAEPRQRRRKLADRRVLRLRAHVDVGVRPGMRDDDRYLIDRQFTVSERGERGRQLVATPSHRDHVFGPRW